MSMRTHDIISSRPAFESNLLDPHYNLWVIHFRTYVNACLCPLA